MTCSSLCLKLLCYWQTQEQLFCLLHVQVLCQTASLEERFDIGISFVCWRFVDSVLIGTAQGRIVTLQFWGAAGLGAGRSVKQAPFVDQLFLSVLCRYPLNLPPPLTHTREWFWHANAMPATHSPAGEPCALDVESGRERERKRERHQDEACHSQGLWKWSCVFF